VDAASSPARSTIWTVSSVLAQIEDLGRSAFVTVDCAGCLHVALLTPEFLRRLGLSLRTKVLSLTERVRCRGCGAKTRAVVSIKWRQQAT
jgi:ribosomal protein S27E